MQTSDVSKISGIDFRAHPEKYRIGRGEQGVLTVEPYKSELLPYWRFKTVVEAEISASTIYKMFLAYKSTGDFVGMDMARKYLQMGYTRARRYANHPSGRKYANTPPENDLNPAVQVARKLVPQAVDWATNVKAQAANVFYDYYKRAKDDKEYQKKAKDHNDRYCS